MGPEFNEIEVKLTLLGEGAVERVLKALGPPTREVEQINFYLDTSSRELHDRRVMLRLRKQGDRAVVTLKTDAEIVRGGLRCREVEESISWVEGQQALQDGLQSLSVAPIKEVRYLVGHSAPLEVIGTVVNLRRWIPFRDLGIVELDQMTLPDGTIHMELELETTSDRLTESIAVLEEFLRSCGVPYSDTVIPKYQRFLDSVQSGKG